MNVEEVRDFCLGLKNVTEDTPFGPDTLVFRVENKIFLMIGLDAEEPNIAVKCNPDEAVILREHYRAVVPAYHMNKKYWNDIYLERDMSDNEMKYWIEHSYHEVVRKLPGCVRKTYL